MSSIVILVIIALILLINILMGALRGMLRSAVRVVLLILCIPVALLLTRLISGALGAAILPAITTALQGLGKEVSGTLLSATDALDALVTMIASAASFTSIYLLLALITKLADKPLSLLAEKLIRPESSSRAVGALLGAVAGVILSVAILCPVTGLLPVASGVTQLMGDPDEGSSSAQLVTEIRAASEAPATKAIRLLGGDLMFSAITTTTYKGESVNLTREAYALTDLVAGYVSLSQSPSTAWGEDEIARLQNAAVSFDDSRITADLAALLLCDMGSAWGNGQPFLGATLPYTGELLDPSLKTLMQALSDSTGASVRTNIHTVANVLEAMIRHNVLPTLQSGDRGEEGFDQTAVLAIFSDEEFTGSMVNALYEDAQLRVMIPEMLNLGVRAMATSLGVPDNYTALYDDMLQQCCNAYNTTAALGETEQMVALGDELYDILHSSGVGISPSTATAMAMGMVADFKDHAEITPADVVAWFATYSAAAATAAEQTSAAPLVTIPTAAPQAPVLLPLSGETTLDLPGAVAVANYIVSMSQSAAPYQVVTLTNRDTGEECLIFSMTDGTLRCIDRQDRLTTPETVGITGLGAFAGGEFSSLACDAPWEATSHPSRVTEELLARYGELLLPHTSPLPEGYVAEPPSDTGVTSSSLQNAQGTQTPIVDTASMLAALNGAINHELANGSHSAGSSTTLLSAETFTSALPCLEAMLLNDHDAICGSMTAEAAATVSQALTSLAAFLTTPEAGEESDLISELFGASGSEIIGAVLDSMTALSGSKDAAVNTLLAGANYLHADITALRQALEGEAVSLSEVTTQMLSTADLLAKLSTSKQPAEQLDAMEALLSSLTESSARAIAAAVSPAMLRNFGLTDPAASSLADMITSAFITLADAKANGMTEEQFRHEADALIEIFTLALQSQTATADRPLFGADGTLGREADALLDTILSSNIVSGAMVKMVGGGRGVYFSVTVLNPLSLPIDHPSDQEALALAIANAEGTLQQYPDSHGELWSPQNNQLTRQDVARRLMAFAALFGLDYSTAAATIPQ